MLMARFHGFGAVATSHGDPGDAAPGNRPSSGFQPSGGGGPVYTTSSGRTIQPGIFSVNQMATVGMTIPSGMVTSSSDDNMGNMIPVPQGGQGGVVIADPLLCAPGQMVDPTGHSCVNITPAPGSTTGPLPVPTSCDASSTLVNGQCVPNSMLVQPFTVPTWGWVAGVGIAGYLAYHFFLAK